MPPVAPWCLKPQVENDMATFEAFSIKDPCVAGFPHARISNRHPLQSGINN